MSVVHLPQKLSNVPSQVKSRRSTSYILATLSGIKIRASHIIWSACSNGLRDWLNKRKRTVPFTIPIIWREPEDDFMDSHFCNVHVRGFTVKTKHKFVYSSLKSARWPISHNNDDLPIPIPPENGLEMSHEGFFFSEENTTAVEDTEVMQISRLKIKTYHRNFSQWRWNDLVRDVILEG